MDSQEYVPDILKYLILRKSMDIDTFINTCMANKAFYTECTTRKNEVYTYLSNNVEFMKSFASKTLKLTEKEKYNEVRKLFSIFPKERYHPLFFGEFLKNLENPNPKKNLQNSILVYYTIILFLKDPWTKMNFFTIVFPYIKENYMDAFGSGSDQHTFFMNVFMNQLRELLSQDPKLLTELILKLFVDTILIPFIPKNFYKNKNWHNLAMDTIDDKMTEGDPQIFQNFDNIEDVLEITNLTISKMKRKDFLNIVSFIFMERLGLNNFSEKELIQKRFSKYIVPFLELLVSYTFVPKSSTQNFISYLTH
jgi:hypothetical protein